MGNTGNTDERAWCAACPLVHSWVIAAWLCPRSHGVPGSCFPLVLALYVRRICGVPWRRFFFDTFQIAYQKSLSHLVRDIATAQPITPGTRFQGTIGEEDIERLLAVSTVAYWLAYGLEFVLKGSHTLLLLGKLLLTL